MLLEKIIKNPVGVLQYLERYVNDGSPSGFTEINKTSAPTDPFGLQPWFHLYVCHGPHAWFHTYGEVPKWPAEALYQDADWILVHPDMVEDTDLCVPELSVALLDTIRVVPTASARTVQFKDTPGKDYAKLHYNRILGRINRALTYKKAVAGPELSEFVIDAINSGKLDSRLTLLPETGARVMIIHQGERLVEWGMVWRSHKPYGPVASSLRYLIPFFSLFSTDRLSPYDPPLLVQLIEVAHVSPVDFLLNCLIAPIIGGYFSLVRQIGLQPEWNAQNLLVGLDSNLNIISIVMRDLGEIEKDLTIRDSLGLPNNFASHPYKCISAEQGDIYYMRHSFQFDFKLGEYILEPLIGLLSITYGVNAPYLQSAAKGIAQPFMDDLPTDFFPRNGMWYKHEKILLTGERPYVSCSSPKYR